LKLEASKPYWIEQRRREFIKDVVQKGNNDLEVQIQYSPYPQNKQKPGVEEGDG